MVQKQPIIYACSDAVGETAEAIAKAAIRQFSSKYTKIKRYGHIQTSQQIIEILREVSSNGGVIAYTLVQPELRETMKEEAISLGIRAIDVLGPLMQAYVDTYNDSPKQEPGIQHELDDEYFRRMEAIDFAVKYDDGKDVRGLLLAEVVLIGVSRTSKTPLSIFLAHKGIKAANLPILPEVKPPAELYQKANRLVIGLTMEPEHLLKIRTERLKALGLPKQSSYATMKHINNEIKIADAVMKQLNCPIINVSDKSIEETAGIIMNYMTNSYYMTPSDDRQLK